MNKSIYTESYQDLINWLKTQRKSQGISMRELGSRLNVPHSFIGKVEQCERRLDVIEFVSYCEALNLSPHDGLNLLTSKNNQP